MSDTTKEKIQAMTEETTCLPAIIYNFCQQGLENMDSENVNLGNVDSGNADLESAKPESSTKVGNEAAFSGAEDAAKPEGLKSEGAAQEKAGQRTPLLQTKAVQKIKWFMVFTFHKLGAIYCHNICTYSNMVLIGAIFLLCITGAFSQASFGILVLLNLVISICSDRKERKRLENVLWKEGTEAELDEVVVRRRKSKLERSLDTYGRRMGAVAVSFSLILFIQAFMFRYESFQGSIISMCSAFVAAMPIGMYFLIHLANFVGAARLSKKGMKVQEKRAVMRLAGTDVLCVGDSSLLGESDSTVIKTLQAFRDDGVRVILISKEEPEVLFEKAKRIGIVDGGQCVDAATLGDMEAMRKAVLRSTVIGNATSLQKSIFVDILRESGNMVTMVAKSEEDCAAVQNADVSVGFAPQGGDVSGLSDMYAENGELDLLATTYKESGALNQNLRNLSSLFFMKNVTALLMALYAIVCSVPYPITLSMWTLLSIFTIGIPSILLFLYTLSDAKRPLAQSASDEGCQKGHGKREERFLLKSIKRGLPTALAGALTVFALLRYAVAFDLDAEGTVTAAVLLLAFAGFLMLGTLCLPISSFDVMMLIICVAGFLCCFIFCKPLFGMEAMNMRIVMLLALFLIAEESLHRLLRFFDKEFP